MKDATTCDVKAQSASAQLREKMAETRENLRDMGHLAKEATQEKLEHLREGAAGTLRRGKDQMWKLEERFEDRILSHPYWSLLAAAGGGLLLGLLWTRRQGHGACRTES
jgi:hypothetical protein